MLRRNVDDFRRIAERFDHFFDEQDRVRFFQPTHIPNFGTEILDTIMNSNALKALGDAL